MKRKIKLLLSTLLMSILIFSSTTFALAAPQDDSSGLSTLSYISEGYTPDGIHYVIYESACPSNQEISPNIVVSKTIERTVIYEGYITPPSSINISEFSNEYNTNMSGTLLLDHYMYDMRSTFLKATVALYKGTLYANI